MLKEATGIERVIIRTGKTDLRFGIDRLASSLQVEYGLDPLEEGTMFLFCGNRKDRIKGLLYEGSGFLLLTKRLSSGSFAWPDSVSEARQLSVKAFRDLMDGYEVTSSEKVYTKKPARTSGAGEADSYDKHESIDDMTETPQPEQRERNEYVADK